MTQKEYNLRMIVFLSVIIIGAMCLALILIKEGKELGWLKTHFRVYKCVVIAVSVIVCVVLLLYMILGISYDIEEISKVKFVDIVHNGSYAGLIDYYSLYVKYPNDTYVWISTPLFSSRELKQQVESLKVGDTVTIKYVSKIQSVYCIETQETTTDNRNNQGNNQGTRQSGDG